MGDDLRWDKVFLAIGVPFGLALLVFMPPVASVDEPAHLVRIDQIAHGGLVSPLDSQGRAVVRADDCVASRYVAMSIWIYARPVLSRQFTAVRCRPTREIDISNTALNSPVSYTPDIAGYGVGRALGGLVWGIWAARIAGLAFYLGLSWLAVRVVPWGKATIALIALLPTSLIAAVRMSADTTSLALAIVATALVLKLRTPRDAQLSGASGVRRPDRTGQMLWALGTCLVMLALAKDLYAVVSLVVLLVPVERFSTWRRQRSFQVSVLGMAALGSGSWTIFVVNRIRLVLSSWQLTDSVLQRDWIRRHPLGFAHIALKSLVDTSTLTAHTLPGIVATWGSFGHGQLSTAPLWVVVGAGALLVAAVRSDTGRLSERWSRAAPAGVVTTRLVPAAILLTTLALVLYGEAVTVTPRLQSYPDITYIEGRFFTPILPLLLLVPFAGRRLRPVPAPATAPGPADRAEVARRSVPWMAPAGIVALHLWFLYTIAMMYR